MTELLIKNILAEELFGTRICESLEDQQIVDYFYKEFLLEKLLYGEPISVPELRKLLRNKIVNFEFIKLDGDVRPARGTTMMKYIPAKDHPKGIRPSSDKVATFFDLDKDAWRSVSRRSKEIVLKKDEEKGKPIVVVKDKSKEMIKKKEEPVVKKPEERPEEKPVERRGLYHFRNEKTGEKLDIQLTPTEALNKLNKLGYDWYLISQKEFQKEQERERIEAEKSKRPITTIKKPEEPKEEIILIPKEEAETKAPPEEITGEPGAEELEK